VLVVEPATGEPPNERRLGEQIVLPRTGRFLQSGSPFPTALAFVNCIDGTADTRDGR
jgi:hypothetical protein